ncbi:MAG: hypothetical protein UU23_C0007G0004 [Candidatus Curtissbacteria bacterium GW2011_GWA1_40_9]|uniref:Uncharacterized protein n=1 Tax=Candidatus Curtissbacteria bacterium GW2011_GWA1_40_9 TaxID=1618408 RepID=A0A0G0TSX7_9BACT|nr:MAG: hypothetical protein UU23_C0007G0004 [Candidatus Curtissbacteria bacterium GW2011_GWA1_40_9]
MFFSFRAVWYAVLVWIFAFFTSGIIIAPWYYVVMPLLVLLLTVYYFDSGELRIIKKKDRDMIIKYGLGGAIFWFFVAGIFSLLEIAGFYYFNLAYYFSDFRNVFLFPVVLLVPVLYGIVLSNVKFKKRRSSILSLKKGVQLLRF